MTREHLLSLMREAGIPQVALCAASGCSGFRMSNFVRGTGELPDALRDTVELTLAAMVEINDSAALPPDWRQVGRMRGAIDEIVVRLRRERSAELRERFASGGEPAPVAA